MALYQDPGNPQETEDLSAATQRLPAARFEFAASAQEDHLARAYALSTDPLVAYAQAGYPDLRDRAATRNAAYRLLGKQRLQERVDYYRQLQNAKLDVREDRILAEIAAIAMSDPLDLLDPHTFKPRKLDEIPPHARAAVKNIRLKVREELAEDGTQTTETEADLQLWDKVKALEMAAKIKGLLAKGDESRPPTVVIDMRAMDAPAATGPVVRASARPEPQPSEEGLPAAQEGPTSPPEDTSKPDAVPTQPTIVFDFLC